MVNKLIFNVIFFFFKMINYSKKKRYLYNSFKLDEKYKLKYVDKLVDVIFLILGIKYWNLKIYVIEC